MPHLVGEGDVGGDDADALAEVEKGDDAAVLAEPHPLHGAVLLHQPYPRGATHARELVCRHTGAMSLSSGHRSFVSFYPLILSKFFFPEHKLQDPIRFAHSPYRKHTASPNMSQPQ